MQTRIKGIQRVTGDEIDLQISEAGEALVAQGDAEYAEIVRQGYAFVVRNTTAVAALITLPTTAVNMAIYNTASDGGRSLIIDAIFAIQAAGAGVLYQAGIIFNLGQTRAALPTNSAMIPLKLNGQGPATDTKAFTTIGGTALDGVTGASANNWNPIGDSTVSAINSLPGMQIFVPVNGRIIVSPGRYCALHILASATGATFQTGFMWHEKVVTLR